MSASGEISPNVRVEHCFFFLPGKLDAVADHGAVSEFVTIYHADFYVDFQYGM